MLDDEFSGFEQGSFESTTFFDYFGEAKYRTAEAKYGYLLEDRMSDRVHSRVRQRVVTDTLARAAMYKAMYGPELARNVDFLEGRTIRTMAQYLALGKMLVSFGGARTVAVVHDTVNGGLLQSTNREDYMTRPELDRSDEALPVIYSKVQVSGLKK